MEEAGTARRSLFHIYRRVWASLPRRERQRRRRRFLRDQAACMLLTPGYLQYTLHHCCPRQDS